MSLSSNMGSHSPTSYTSYSQYGVSISFPVLFRLFRHNWHSSSPTLLLQFKEGLSHFWAYTPTGLFNITIGVFWNHYKSWKLLSSKQLGIIFTSFLYMLYSIRSMTLLDLNDFICEILGYRSKGAYDGQFAQAYPTIHIW